MKHYYRRSLFGIAALAAIVIGALGTLQAAPLKDTKDKTTKSDDKNQPVGHVVKTEAEWKKILTPEQFDVTRKAGTEPAFHNEYFNNHQAGIYRCADCGLELFTSKTKFESGTGWPSFWQPIAENHITKHTDHELGYERTEVRCARCGAHLGHVFDDGPKPTGLRFCMNSVSLKFVKEDARDTKKDDKKDASKTKSK